MVYEELCSYLPPAGMVWWSSHYWIIGLQ